MTTLTQLEEIMSDRREEWYDKPEKIQEGSDVGDLHIQYFLDNYVGGRLDQHMDLFDRAFALLTERPAKIHLVKCTAAAICGLKNANIRRF